MCLLTCKNSLYQCCNHPYLVDVSLQSLQRKGLSEVEILDADINASSKLQLLDIILSELRLEGQRVLILFQVCIVYVIFIINHSMPLVSV